MRDKDIFSQRGTGRPSDEGARSVGNKQGKIPSLARGYLNRGAPRIFSSGEHEQIFS